ncbi:MAG: FHA domain-containing protein [Candidatus Ancillula sp.]|jgi:pSer/pThr/pTyr-binding forkhead associated (FHA) protein|nr:FHA domain-containing protein [Candidatus Ancillula sp.]
MDISDATSIGIPSILEPIIDQNDKDNDFNTLKKGNAVLVTLDSAKQRFLIDQDVSSVGRDSNSDIFLDDHSVSRRHAEIIRKGDVFSIADVGSLNGTYVNNELQEEHRELKSGDTVQIGKFRLAFYKN